METQTPDILALQNVESIKRTWSGLFADERWRLFNSLPRPDAEELFLGLSPADQAELIRRLAWPDRRSWLRLLHPDDATDLIQEFPIEERKKFLDILDEETKTEVIALLAYAEDVAGGIMNPRFARLRPDTTVDVAIRYLRAQARKQGETIHYAYVIDDAGTLVGVVSFRQLLVAPPETRLNQIMKTDLVSVPEAMDQEEVSKRFAQAGFSALPVVDKTGRMKGIVTADDVADVVEEEATEDIQKLGGTEALEAPYMQVSLVQMIKKRAGWLTILFVSEMFTATALGYFEHEIEKAVVLALFLPLIVSSGGNSGSQATTLVIRAMALGEVHIRDWWKIFGREVLIGLALGLILAIIGYFRILLWPNHTALYGVHYPLIAITVAFSLIGIVLWGTLVGSMLPLMMKKVGFDPASASAPFIATLVDVTGIIIYFTVASIVLKGVLL